MVATPSALDTTSIWKLSTTVDAAIKEWAEVLRQLPKVDHIFVPGGDPGHTQPKYLMPMLVMPSYPDTLLDDPALRYESTGGLASRVSIHPAVRKALFQRQVDFANQPGGAVLDGRDIGTVIAPEAEAKLFVVASVPARAERRFKEMQAQGRAVSLAEIAADLEARDLRDRTRAEAPLTAAPDAVLLDTSDLGRDAAIAEAIRIVRERAR